MQIRKSRYAACLCALAGVNSVAWGVVVSAAAPDPVATVATLFNAPCPPGCNGQTYPGQPPLRRLIDPTTQYTCCKAGLCRTCSDCPWYNPFCW